MTNHSQLEALIARLAPAAWPRRFRHEFDRRGHAVTLTHGAMSVVVRALDEGGFEVLSEHALHEVTRQRCDFEQAVWLVAALLKRDRLGKIELPPR
jgi:hypothetical protein